MIAVDGGGTLAERVVALRARGIAVLALGTDATAAATLPDGTTLDRVALALLHEHLDRTPFAVGVRIGEPHQAERIFARAAAPLFSAEWEAWLGPDVDPEIAGLRAPERFAIAAFRLIRRLRDARIDPETFARHALRGAATFYAAPPNLASPALLFAVKDEHRPSLAVDAVELERQRAREIDLARVIGKLYQAYLDATIVHGVLTRGDAVAEAVAVIDAHAEIARAVRARWAAAVIASAHDLRGGEIDLLERLFPNLRGVTAGGNPALATQTFAGARPERIFEGAETAVIDDTNAATPARVRAAAQALIAADGSVAVPAGPGLQLLRASQPAAEAVAVADLVAARIRDGVAPERIAVIGRTLRTMGPLVLELAARGVPVALRGDAALAHQPDVLDALAALWIAVDPFQHAWTLRVLALPAFALSDASIAILCGEPTDPQAALFALPAEADDRERRWDRRRDLRLATNLVHGDRDADLGDDARARVLDLRARRQRWGGWLAAGDLAELAPAIVADAGIFQPRPGESAARADVRAALVARVLAVVRDVAAEDPFADAAGVLDLTLAALRADEPPEIDDRRPGRVVVAAVDRARHDEVDEVFVVDVRAGAFPPYYVPDAFLFSPQVGMVPKDAVGDAVAARTAKFTWYLHRAKLRERYNDEARRLLAVALTRARVSATVSAGGRATRGVAAPELLAILMSLAPDATIAAPPRRVDLAAADIVPAAPANVSPRAAPRFLGLEEAAGLCAACAARERALVGGEVAPLLRGRPIAGWTIAARDVRVVFTLRDGTRVAGRIDGIATDGTARYVVVHGTAGAARAALAAAALGDVERSAFLRSEADGTLSGPHPCDEDSVRTLGCEGCGGTSPAN